MDEVIERADPHIGLLRRGTEKLIKTKLTSRRIFRSFRLRPPMNREHAWALAVERALDVTVPNERNLSEFSIVKLEES